MSEATFNRWRSQYGGMKAEEAKRLKEFDKENPRLKKPLPKSPKWTFVNGQIVYVCCPPCTKKILANPVPHLRKIDELYSASLQAKRTGR